MRDQEIICVLGMHRSGTSLLTRILNLAGVEIGSDKALTTEPVADNPKGYWEHHALTGISDAIIKRYGGTWDQPPVLRPGWESDAAFDDLRHRARQLIDEQFSNASIWGWKDPRTCLTLPFWQLLLPRMRYVVCLRNPVDVAASLARRDGFSNEKSFSLWLAYVSAALKYSEGKPRLVVVYEDLMNDCFGELQRIAEFLGTSERASQPDVREAVQEFIDPNLQHHHSVDQSSGGGSRLEFEARRLYDALRTHAVTRS
jgi:hypothetical protein